MISSTMEFKWAGFKNTIVGEGIGYFLVAIACAFSVFMSSTTPFLNYKKKKRVATHAHPHGTTLKWE